MPLLTFVARLSDGLPLVESYSRTSVASSNNGRGLEEHKSQAKQILRGLGGRSVAKLSIETSNSKTFHYLIRDNICYLTLTDSSYPKRLAFLYLDEIADCFIQELMNEFGSEGSTAWRNQVETAARPYAFIKYDSLLQRKERDFSDPSSRKNTIKINEDLADIQSIMRKNIEDVLNRGEKLDSVSQISGDLVTKSKDFKWGAKKLTWQAMLNQYGPIVAISILVLFVFYVKLFM